MGSALNDLSREVGGALGTAVIGSIVTAVYRSSLQLPGAPAPLVGQARASFAVAIHAGGSTGAHARDAFVNGIHTGLLYAAGAGDPRRHQRRHPAQDRGQGLANSSDRVNDPQLAFVADADSTPPRSLSVGNWPARRLLPAMKWLPTGTRLPP